MPAGTVIVQGERPESVVKGTKVHGTKYKLLLKIRRRRAGLEKSPTALGSIPRDGIAGNTSVGEAFLSGLK